jgi:uncharacterized membrane protein
MQSPYSPGRLFAFLAVLVILVAVIQVGAITIAFDKLGLSSSSAYLLLFASLFGSAINLPLFQMSASGPVEPVEPVRSWGILRPPPKQFEGKTLVAVNVGGAIIPMAFSLYLLMAHSVGVLEALAGIVVVSAVSRLVSRPISGLGIGMPIFIAPVTAAVTAVMINSAHSAPLAYISGTLGVLIGADVLRLKDIRRLGTPFASVGGAGTFDGIFITGILAVLLA